MWGDIDRDGEEGNADGYGGNSNIHFFYGKDDNRDGEEKVKEIGEVEASSGDESSESSSLSNGAGSSSEWHTTQMPLMDIKNLQFSLEDRDYSKIN